MALDQKTYFGLVNPSDESLLDGSLKDKEKMIDRVIYKIGEVDAEAMVDKSGKLYFGADAAKKAPQKYTGKLIFLLCVDNGTGNSRIISVKPKKTKDISLPLGFEIIPKSYTDLFAIETEDEVAKNSNDQATAYNGCVSNTMVFNVPACRIRITPKHIEDIDLAWGDSVIINIHDLFNYECVEDDANTINKATDNHQDDFVKNKKEL